jgi:hypothetical protein
MRAICGDSVAELFGDEPAGERGTFYHGGLKLCRTAAGDVQRIVPIIKHLAAWNEMCMSSGAFFKVFKETIMSKFRSIIGVIMLLTTAACGTTETYPGSPLLSPPAHS